MTNKEVPTIKTAQPQERTCDTCKNAPMCHKVVGYMFGTCNMSYEPIEVKGGNV